MTPTAITFETGETSSLSVITLAMPMWQGPGRVSRQTTIDVSDTQASTLSAMLLTSKFWTEPGFQPSTGISEGSWILEGRRGTAYHLVHRPTFKGSRFEKLSDTLVMMSGLQLAENR